MIKKVFVIGFLFYLLIFPGLIKGQGQSNWVYYLGTIVDGYPTDLIFMELTKAKVRVVALQQGMIIFGINENTKVTKFLKNFSFLTNAYDSPKAVFKDATLKKKNIVHQYLSLVMKNAKGQGGLKTSLAGSKTSSVVQNGQVWTNEMRLIDKMIKRRVKSGLRSASKGIRVMQEDDSYEENDTFDTAAEVSPGTISGLQCLDDDWYKIYVSQGQDLMVTLIDFDATSIFGFRLYDSTHKEINDYFDGMCWGGNLSAGYYYIYVNCTEGDIRSYGLAIQVGDIGGTISGTVTDEASVGIDDLQVGFIYNELWIGDVRTNSSGIYTIELPPGGYLVWFGGPTAGNYISEYYDNKPSEWEADIVTVTSGNTTAGINAQLAPGGMISGRVTEESTGIGVKELWAEAYDISSENMLVGWFYNSDSDGYYTIRGLPPGQYKAVFSSFLNYFPEWYNNKEDFYSADTIIVTVGNTTAGINAELAVGGAISGRVTNEITGDGISEYTASIYDLAGNYLTSALTDTNGHYTAIRLNTGNCKVYFYDPYAIEENYIPEWYNNKQTFETADQIAVTAGQTTAGINAQLAPTKSISITDPTSSTIWTKGQNVSIQWNSTGSIPSVNIYLYKGGGKVKDIAIETSNDKTEGWTVADDLQEGTDYMVRIEDISDSSIYGTTNNFTIQVAKSITVTNPTSSTVWIKGQAGTIAWTFNGPISAVNIYLYKAGAKTKDIALSSANDGIETWAAPKDLVDGTDYTIKIEDASSSSVFAYSAAFTIKARAILNAPILSAPSDGVSGQAFDIYLQWQDTNSTPQESGYRIRIKPAGGAYIYFKTSQDAISYLKTGLKPNKTYFWNVMAVGNGTTIKNSAWANGGADWRFTTHAPVTLNAPILLAPTDGAIGQPLSVTLQWEDTNSSPQEQGYQGRIKRRGGAYTYFMTLHDAISYLKKGLARNKTYYWNVRAKGNGTGTKDSAWANAGVDWEFTTIR